MAEQGQREMQGNATARAGGAAAGASIGSHLGPVGAAAGAVAGGGLADEASKKTLGGNQGDVGETKSQ